MITHAALRAALDYDPTSGVFVWKLDRGRGLMGAVAGCLKDDGYRLIAVCGKIYRAHRLAWFYVHGVWPKGDIDHRNCKRDDNRLDNLREATESQNNANAKKRGNLKGAHRHRSGKWRGQIKKGGRVYYLGHFDTQEEAHAAYCAAATKLYGEFARME